MYRTAKREVPIARQEQSSDRPVSTVGGQDEQRIGKTAGSVPVATECVFSAAITHRPGHVHYLHVACAF